MRKHRFMLCVSVLFCLSLGGVCSVESASSPGTSPILSEEDAMPSGCVWYKYIEVFSAPVGILITTVVAVYLMHKTTTASRISNVHAEMCSCLVDTVITFTKVIVLLNDIARRVVYANKVTSDISESAYERYWREIGSLSTNYKEITAKQRLVVPEKLFQKIKGVVIRLNKAGELARDARPNDNHVYPDTTELQKAVDEVQVAYHDFLNEARSYLGTPRMGPIADIGEASLQGREEKK